LVLVYMHVISDLCVGHIIPVDQRFCVFSRPHNVE